MSSPASTCGHQISCSSRPSLAVASSCSCGPAVDVALDEAGRLHDRRVAAVVEVGDLRVPAPAGPGGAGLGAAVLVRRDAVLQLARAGRAWLDAVDMNWRLLSCRANDVVMLLTNMSYRPSSLRSAKSIPMPLNESSPSSFDFGTNGLIRAVHPGEPDRARGGPVVEQRVLAEVVGQVELGQLVAVEVVGAGGEHPAVGDVRSAARRRPAGTWPSARIRPTRRSTGTGGPRRRWWRRDSDRFIATPPLTVSSRTGPSGK